jgi:hypothetical protein
LRLILDGELSARNKIQSNASVAVPLTEFSIGIINWRTEELRKLDRKRRKLLATLRHHQTAVVGRFSFHRKQEVWNDAVGRSLHSTSYGADGICGQQKDPVIPIIRSFDTT